MAIATFKCDRQTASQQTTKKKCQNVQQKKNQQTSSYLSMFHYFNAFVCPEMWKEFKIK